MSLNPFDITGQGFNPVNIAMQNVVSPLSQRAVQSQEQYANSQQDRVFGNQIRANAEDLNQQRTMASVAMTNAQMQVEQQRLQMMQTQASQVANEHAAQQKAFQIGQDLMKSGINPDQWHDEYMKRVTPDMVNALGVSGVTQASDSMAGQYIQNQSRQAAQQYNGQFYQAAIDAPKVGVPFDKYILPNTPPEIASQIKGGYLPENPAQYMSPQFVQDVNTHKNQAAANQFAQMHGANANARIDVAQINALSKAYADNPTPENLAKLNEATAGAGTMAQRAVTGQIAGQGLSPESTTPPEINSGSSLTPDQQAQTPEAIAWAKANPKDPRSAKILSKVGSGSSNSSGTNPMSNMGANPMAGSFDPNTMNTARGIGTTP